MRFRPPVEGTTTGEMRLLELLRAGLGHDLDGPVDLRGAATVLPVKPGDQGSSACGPPLHLRIGDGEWWDDPDDIPLARGDDQQAQLAATGLHRPHRLVALDTDQQARATDLAHVLVARQSLPEARTELFSLHSAPLCSAIDRRCPRTKGCRGARLPPDLLEEGRLVNDVHDSGGGVGHKRTASERRSMVSRLRFAKIGYGLVRHVWLLRATAGFLNPSPHDAPAAGFTGAILAFMTSATFCFISTAPMGRPPARGLARVMMSGRTPEFSYL